MSEATPKGILKVAITDFNGDAIPGAGAAVSIADGADVAEGTRADAAWDGVAASATVVSILKKIATSGAAAGLTDAQLRASAVPVSLASVPTHAVTLTSTTITGSVAVTGPLTDAQLRASAVPVTTTPSDALEVPFTTTTPAAVGTTDATKYAWVSVHVVTQGGSSTIAFQGSNDNTNWVAVPLQNAGATTASTATTTTSAGILFHGALPFRYFRLNVTGIASGTTAGVLEFYPVAHALSSGLTQATPADAQSGSLSTTTAAFLMGYNGSNWDRLRQTIANGLVVDVSRVQGSVAVTGPLTDAQLRASAVPVSLASTTITGSVAVTGPLTDAQLRASAVPVSLASTTITGSVAVTGPLTDAQLRASAVPVTLTSTTITGTVDVSDRAGRALGVVASITAAVDVSDRAARALGVVASITNPVAVTGTFWQATQPVSGPLTDVQLRATALPTADAPVRGLLESMWIEQMAQSDIITATSDKLNPRTPGDALGNDPGLPILERAHLWNGTSWDRERSNVVIQSGDAGVQTVTFNGKPQINYDSVGVLVGFIVGAVTGTTPTLVFGCQWSPDGGTNWFGLGGGGTSTQITIANTNGVLYVGPTAMAANMYASAGAAAGQLYLTAYLPRLWRITYTIGGTGNPSFELKSVTITYIKG